MSKKIRKGHQECKQERTKIAMQIKLLNTKTFRTVKFSITFHRICSTPTHQSTALVPAVLMATPWPLVMLHILLTHTKMAYIIYLE